MKLCEGSENPSKEQPYKVSDDNYQQKAAPCSRATPDLCESQESKILPQICYSLKEVFSQLRFFFLENSSLGQVDTELTRPQGC